MKLRKYRIPVLFSCMVALFFIGVQVIDELTTPTTTPVTDEDDRVIQTGIPVQTGEVKLSEETFISPVANDIELSRYFYEQDSEHSAQALDYFEGVYRPSLGVDYCDDASFEVLAALSGTVLEVKKDAMLGVCVRIECENGLHLIYQSLSKVNVSEGESLSQGSIVGYSGNNIYEAELGNHLHFTVEKDGKAVNPLSLYQKKVSQIQ